MAKKKASVKGRGIDILLGGSAEAEPETTPAWEGAAPSSEGASTAPNPFAESLAAPADYGGPFAEPAPPAESALSSEALGGQPPAPVATSLPPEDKTWLADAALPIPDTAGVDSSAIGEAVSVALPADSTLIKTPRIGGLIMSMPSVPHPESFEPPTELTQTGLKVAGVSKTKMTVSEEEVMRRIGDRIQALSQRIESLYAQVAGGAISDTTHASEALLYLRRARDKELEDQRQFDEAEYLVNVAQYLVTHSGQVRQWSYSYGVVILLYGLLWMAAFSVGLFLELTGLAQTWLATFIPNPNTVATVSAFFATIMAGGVGGVLGVLYSLFKHIAVRQDFDRQFVMWYIVQPFLGLLMGFIVHLFFVAGVFALVNATGEAFRFIGLLVAIAAAFRQHYVYAWLESILKAFQPGGRDESANGAAAASVAVPQQPPARPEFPGVG
jgi:hypothetical protein